MHYCRHCLVILLVLCPFTTRAFPWSQRAKEATLLYGKRYNPYVGPSGDVSIHFYINFLASVVVDGCSVVVDGCSVVVDGCSVEVDGCSVVVDWCSVVVDGCIRPGWTIDWDNVSVELLESSYGSHLTGSERHRRDTTANDDAMPTSLHFRLKLGSREVNLRVKRSAPVLNKDGKKSVADFPVFVIENGAIKRRHLLQQPVRKPIKFDLSPECIILGVLKR
ncbi:hypothetical protein ElyMa_003614100 [Elysia marginata]|uniref:Uncharacterized protein n=1 Tax=Elysia marginata TaxID=1093978 RepID=A0AAV4ERJ4_9GAST|nr:hypothetical protein ElyMa_003614100 [Elysia marginata]